ncbi:MAG: hypothetical protein GYB66_04005 [Chloroflexi bacterium]|nr:hypothetical protein [Chloroflexota bacterium]
MGLELSTAATFASQFGLGVIAGLLVIAWFAAREQPDRVGAWLDVALAALITGTITGRAVHVLLEWDYFSDFPEDAWRIWYGGMSWEGALLGGLLSAAIMCRLRRVSFTRFSDALALAWPLGMMTAWWACRRAGCAYGETLDEHDELPKWMTGYLPDITGDMALRVELQIFGVWVSVVIFTVALVLTIRGWLAGFRLWTVLFLTGGAMFIIGFFRGDPARTMLGLRLDQNLAAVLIVSSVLIGFGQRRLLLDTARTISDTYDQYGDSANGG